MKLGAWLQFDVLHPDCGVKHKWKTFIGDRGSLAQVRPIESGTVSANSTLDPAWGMHVPYEP